MPVIAIAWLYAVLLASLAEATSTGGTLLGATLTLVLYGVLPLAIVIYVLLGPARKRARRGAEAEPSLSPLDPDQRGHPASDTVAPKRKEP